jgi:hypothetical protein
LKEEAAGVGILSVLVAELDSLLCADVKNLLCIAVRHPTDVASADTHLRDVVIVQEREGSYGRCFEALVSVKVHNYGSILLSPSVMV